MSLSPFDPDDLVPHGLDVLETLLVDQAVDQNEALAVPDVQIPHGGELLGAGRVQDLQHRRRGVHLNLLPVEIFDGRVVFLYEGPGDKLDGQRGLAHPAAAQDHHLILPHSASAGSGMQGPKATPAAGTDASPGAQRAQWDAIPGYSDRMLEPWDALPREKKYN